MRAFSALTLMKEATPQRNWEHEAEARIKRSDVVGQTGGPEAVRNAGTQMARQTAHAYLTDFGVCVDFSCGRPLKRLDFPFGEFFSQECFVMNSAEILGLFAWLEENDQSLDLGLIRDVLQQNQEPVDSSHQKAIRDYTARSVGIRTTLDLDDDWDTLNLVWGPVHTALLQQAPALWGSVLL